MTIWLIQRAEPTPLDNFGKQRILRTGVIAQKLATLGHEVIWWTSTFDHYNKKNRYLNSKLVKISSNYHIFFIKSFGYKKNFSILRLFDLLYLSFNFKRILNKFPSKPDVIISSIPSVEMTYIAACYAKKHKIPIYVDIRDLWPDIFLDLAPKYLFHVINFVSKPYKYLNKITLQKANGIIALTQEFLNWGLDIAERKQIDNDIVVPMAYSNSKLNFSNCSFTNRILINNFLLENDAKYLTIVFAGTIGKMFDFSPVLNAANYFLKSKNKIRFIICGAGDNLNELKFKCKAINNIYFTSWLTKDELTTIYEISNLAIAPYINSVNFKYNIPNKPAEYLSNKLPILSSLDYGPLNNILNNYNCGFTYANDNNILINQILFLDNNRDILLKMSDNAYSVYLKYFQSELVYEKLIKHVTK